MGRNIEIKARAFDLPRQRGLAEAIVGHGPVVIHQRDIFFQVPDGRLKLRLFPPDGGSPTETPGELIAYHRPDQLRPKASDYVISPTPDGQTLFSALSKVLPVLGEVNKTRELYLVGQTRIHFDQVHDMGAFIELEVVLNEGQSIAYGEEEAGRLMTRLNIDEGDLITHAYIDMLLARGESSS